MREVCTGSLSSGLNQATFSTRSSEGGICLEHTRVTPMAKVETSGSPFTPPLHNLPSCKSLETLGLGRSPAADTPQLPSDLTPATRNRIIANAETAKRVLEWSEKTEAISALRASELWRVERLIEKIPCFGVGEVDAGGSDIAVITVSLRISDNLLGEVRSVVDLLARMQNLQQDIVVDEDGSRKVGSKLLSYVVATAASSAGGFVGSEKNSAPESISPGLLFRAVHKLANRVVCNPEDKDAPRMAAIIGLCVSCAWCPESETILHLTWIRMIRALRGRDACLAHACVAAVLPQNGKSRIGKHAALALTVLSRVESIFSSFAALHVGMRPGFEALKTPIAALELVSAALTLDEPIFNIIVEEFSCEFLGDV